MWKHADNIGGVPLDILGGVPLEFPFIQIFFFLGEFILQAPPTYSSQ